MLHLHVVIGAAILLVAAFAALIICMCVDIIPIIKSRASTLASRDSATQEQAMQLKKSLQQARHQLSHKGRLYGRSDNQSSRKPSANRNIYECDNRLSAVTVEAHQLTNAAPCTFTTCTATTATVVITTASAGDELKKDGCFTTPEGDHSTQHTSSAASSLSQSSNQRKELTSVGNRSCSPSKRKHSSTSQVAVSVHSSVTQDNRLHRSPQASPAPYRSQAKQRFSTGTEDRHRTSVPSSPLARSGRHSTTELLQSTRSYSPSVVRCSSAVLPGRVTPDCFSSGTGRLANSSSRCSSQQSIRVGESARADGSLRKDNFAIEGEPQVHPKVASLAAECRDPTRDSTSRKSAPHREQSPCKWCYSDHRQCSRHHSAKKQPSSGVDDPATAPLLSNHGELRDVDDAESCPCPYHIRNGQHPTFFGRDFDPPGVPGGRHTPRSRGSTGSPYERQISPSRSLSGGTSALHGSFHRSSPCNSTSSSVSPSSLSSSSHSCQRRRRTKLEDIQEHGDSSAAEQEPKEKQKEPRHVANSQRNTPSNLHSSEAVEGVDIDLEQKAHRAGHCIPSPHAVAKYDGRSLARAQNAKTVIEGLVTYSGS